MSSLHDYKIFKMNQTETNEFKKHKQIQLEFSQTEKAFSKLAHNYYNLADINKNTKGR